MLKPLPPAKPASDISATERPLRGHGDAAKCEVARSAQAEDREDDIGCLTASRHYCVSSASVIR